MQGRMKELVARLNEYAEAYYAFDAPKVSDAEYDALFDQLLALEAETGVVLPDSPTKRVGGEPLAAFTQQTHLARLWSMDKVRTKEELLAWGARVERLAAEYNETHDLSVVKHISTEIAVMYLGQCVERVSSDRLFENPLHPYTKALLAAIPIPRLMPRKRGAGVIKGEVSNPINPKPGCRFAARCPNAGDRCLEDGLKLIEAEPGHFVACTLYEGGAR